MPPFEILFAPVGLLIVVFVMIDAVRTTLAVGRGAGPVTQRLTHALWVLLLRHHPRHRRLRHAGMVLLLMVFTSWILGVLVGWVLVFHASRDAVVSSMTQQPADLWERLYFVGYTMMTLGNGEYVPDGPLWQVITVLTALNGLFLVTLGITYLVPVASAATQKRELGGVVTALGGHPDEILLSAWDGEAFQGLDAYFPSLVPEIGMLGQRHLTYPVLHYFHNADRDTASAPSIAVLDEALTLLEAGVAPDVRLGGLGIQPLRAVLSQLLGTLESAFVEPADAPPPAPDLGALRLAGVPTVDDQTFAADVARLEYRRRLLRAYVEDDGWSWDDVVGKPHRDPDDPRQEGGDTTEDERV